MRLVETIPMVKSKSEARSKETPMLSAIMPLLETVVNETQARATV